MMPTSSSTRMDESGPVKVVHFLNQFFGGVGGEDKAGYPARVFEGPLGPGRRLQEIAGSRASIRATMVCGDDFFHAHADDAVAMWRAVLIEHRPEWVVAGPCFDAGRYGLAAARICGAAELAIPAITGMHPDNPGMAGTKKNPLIYVMPTTRGVAGLEEVLVDLCRLGAKLGHGLPIGPAALEGYLPRGIRRNRFRDSPGSVRATAMLLRRESGAPGSLRDGIAGSRQESARDENRQRPCHYASDRESEQFFAGRASGEDGAFGQGARGTAIGCAGERKPSVLRAEGRT